MVTDNTLTVPFKIPPIYLDMAKQVAIDLANTYASVNPLVGLGVTVAKVIFDRTAAAAKIAQVLGQAQAEKWTETDPRWDAPLADQQARMDAEDKRHDAMRSGNA